MRKERHGVHQDILACFAEDVLWDKSKAPGANKDCVQVDRIGTFV